MGSLRENTCLDNRTVISSGLWLGDNPLESTFSLLCVQVVIVTLCSRLLYFLFKPSKLAKVSTDILTSLLLGPSVLGRWAPSVRRELFPESSKVALSTLGQLGIVYWFFLMGIQMNVGTQLKRIEKKSMAVAVAGIVSPIVISHLSFFAANSLVPESMTIDINAFYIAAYFTVPAVTVVANTVIQHKLLETPFGRLGLSSAVSIQLMLVAVFFVLLSAKPTPGHPWAPLFRLAYSSIFAAVVCALSRTILVRIRNTTNDSFISFILVMVAFAAGVTEAIGVHTTTGAFVVGLCMPDGLLAAACIKKLEDVVALIVPLTLTTIGQQIDLAEMFTAPRGWTLLVVLLATFFGKSIVVGLVATFFNYTFLDGCLAGVLLSSKGIVDAMLLAWSTKVEDGRLVGQGFVILIFGIIANNLTISLLIKLFHSRASSTRSNISCRTVQHVRSDTPFGILACFHGHHMVTTLISLLKATQATPKSPIKLSALHLVHATAGVATVLTDANNSLNSSQDENGPIRVAFKSQQSMHNIFVEHFVRMSPYSTMHEDIANLAIENDAAFIIVPFQQHLSGTAESSGKLFRSVTQNILMNAPCSVGILVHRGLMRTCTDAFRHITVLFLGGPDDREALAFAARMAKQDGTNLNVVRFLPASQLTKPSKMGAPWTPINSMQPVADDSDREKVVDDYCINHFQMEMAGKNSVTYMEKFVSCGAETVAFIQSMNQSHELFIVGRRQPTINSAMISGMEDWNEFPELGLMGDFLVSPDFSSVSVLVVQQHVWRKDVNDKTFLSLEGRKQSSAIGVWDSSEYNSSLTQTAGQREPGWQWNLHVAF